MNIVSSCSDFALVGILSVVKQILQLIQIVGPILLTVSLSINFIKLVNRPDDKKIPAKIRNSIIALFVVFFVPLITNVVFGMLDDSTPLSSCWEMAGKMNHNATYIPVDDRRSSSIIGDPSNYEDGKKKIDQLVYYYQANYGDTPFCSGKHTVASSGCGAVSFAMIASTYSNPSFEPRNVSKWFCANKPSLSNGGLNEDAIPTRDTLSHFGLKGEVLFDKTGGSSYNYGTTYNSSEGSAMLKAVNAGKSVMFGMPGHWSVVGPNKECSNDKFYLYNPSRPTANGCYTPQELFNYTYNYSNRCQTTGWCGWDVAIALYS